MTRSTNARVAGFTYLLYIALAYPAMALFGRAAGAGGVAAKLARVAQHAGDMRVAIVLTLATCFTAIVLGVTLYALTRDEDPELAMVALACRIGEGLLAAIFLLPKLEVLWLGTAGGGDAPDPEAARAIGALLINGTRAWNATVGATFFAVGSTLFSWLLLRGRTIPVTLGWLGVVASVLLVIGLPLQLVGVLHDPATQLMWIPMAAFEIPLGVYWLARGAAPAPAVPRPAR